MKSSPVFRFLTCAAALGARVGPAHSQALSDKDGYDSLLGCAAFFSAAAAVTDSDKEMSDQAVDLAKAFMAGAVLLVPDGKTEAAEKALEEQAQVFVVAMMSDDKTITKDLKELADNCGTLGEEYLPEVMARAGE